MAEIQKGVTEMNTEGGRCMSKPRYIWWSYAKAMIRQYPKLNQNAADKQQLQPVKQKEYDAVKKAVEITNRKANAANRMEIVKLVLWHEGCTLEQAAARLYLSESTANRYHHDFVCLVGQCYGLTE